MNYREIQEKISSGISDESIIRDYSKDGVTFINEDDKIHRDFGFSSSNDENIKIYSFWFNIAYYDLEKILCPIVVNNELFGDSETKFKDIYSSFEVDTDIKNHLPKEGKEINNESDINYITNLFINFYKEDALPFFEKWKDLTVLYEYIKDKSEEELWDILGQFAPMKKATILRLCNDKGYQEFMDSYFEKQREYYEEDPNDIDNIRYYNAAKELKEVLDKTEPIYNL